jgi:hypothetical protein
MAHRPTGRLTMAARFALIAAMTTCAFHYYWFTSSHTGGAQGLV